MRRAAVGAAAVLLLAGCGAARGEPTVTGVVAGVDGADGSGSPQLAEPSDAYYHQIPLAAPGVEYRDAAGGEIEAGDLRDGDLVSVWIGDGCAESFPPQCDLRAVHVTG
ncbi:hypothetical protein [Cellulomonas hominis]|uniref:hypothetical protein n=1 Tax=Cellulomonas hominis TaxID=156981 RepID=UPI001444101B|nr:hypothetical protein [Cellulomonas hominis]NKY08872.1 hypothetical protein [Cellulomonas hominis]